MLFRSLKKGKTSIRAGYGMFFDQPVTNSVTGLSTNLPFVNNIRINSPPSFGNPFLGTLAGAALNVNAISPGFENSYSQNWNLNIQQEIVRDFSVMVGYFGAKGTHLRLSRNLNQPVAGVLPFATITLVDGTKRSANVIGEIASVGNSSYNALWVSANKRFSGGLQLKASYTFSKAIDYNSLNSQGVILQDSTNPRNNRGLADFDARHRFVISYLYELPFHGNRLVKGWQVAGTTTLQSGNPLNIVLGGTPALTNLAVTVRPDLVGNPSAQQTPNNFFNPLAFQRTSTAKFGNLGRNSPLVIGPGFNNFDFSVLKTTSLAERYKVEFRTEFFNIFNHPNFSQPGRLCTPSSASFTVSSISGQVFPAGTCVPNSTFGTIANATTGATITPTTFAQILGTRGPTSDAGSSRQIQFALKFIF